MDESQELTIHKPLTPQQQELLKALKLGNSRAASYSYVGVSRTTFYRWMEENGIFRDSVTRAEAQAEVAHVGVLAQAANGGDWRASLEWLKRRRRDEWGDSIAISTDKRAEELLSKLFPEDAGADPEEVGTGDEPARNSESVTEF